MAFTDAGKPVMKVLIYLCLSLSALSAQAELRQFGQSPGNTSYYDTHTVIRTGNKVQVWTITEFRQREAAGFLSTRTHKELDCKSQEERSIQFMAYADSKGQGKVVGEVNESNAWQSIPPGTRNSRLLHMVCGD
jgi:hypothetical protein